MLRSLGILVAGAAIASAQPRKAPKAADETFERGRRLLDKGDYAGACAAFQQSLDLDFQFGTLYNIADCEVKQGKLASALKAYRKIAHDDFNPGRKQSAQDLIASLEPRVPTVTITVSPRPAGLAVLLDETPVDDLVGTEIPIDLGPHTIKATATGRQTQTKQLDAKEGELAQISLKFGDPPTAPAPMVPMAPIADPGSSRGTYGKAFTIGGGAMLATGLVIGGFALKDWRAAQTTAMTDPARANDEVHRTRILGDVSTVLVVVGAAAIGTGLYLWHSDHGATISPQLAKDGGGLSLSGSF